MSSNPAHGEVYLIQHYVINFVSELGHVSGFLQVLQFPPQITEKFLKVALNTLTLTLILKMSAEYLGMNKIFALRNDTGTQQQYKQKDKTNDYKHV